MVMHARKTQRMNDGYFEKHQAHPYQNSKYSSSKSYGSSGERYDRIKDSPNGNYRSDSPDSQSPRDRERSYQSKSSYLQKIREKERENRDYKRDKYSECARSPKDKRSRELEHRTNNDRNEDKGILHPIKVSQNLSSRDRKPLHNNSVDKAPQRDERDRVPRVGDWSEHVSSSGKKYYYNCKTEVSQWEKPREWIERERERERERDRFRSRERERDRDSDRSYSRSGHEKHSNSRSSSGKESSSRNDPNSTTGGSSSRHWSNRDDVPPVSTNADKDSTSSSSSRSSTSRKHQHPSTQQPPQQQQQQQQQEENASQQDMDISPGDSTPTSELSFDHQQQQQVGPVLLATALPRIVPHHHHHSNVHHHHHHHHHAHHHHHRDEEIASNAPGPPPLPPPDKNGGVQRIGGGDNNGAVIGVVVDNVSVGGGAKEGVAPVVVGEGPPTPTHSENVDCGGTKVVSVPASSPSVVVGGGLPTLQGMSSSLQALRPQGPSITPSLANHYRDDLVNHVRGWPAEILERQAQKLAEEAHIMSSIQCSKVSAELKSARSIVRLTEIQATLQEQRILFLRQQIKELEELKSQNSFMSDDS